jgi:hypothetical protein
VVYPLQRRVINPIVMLAHDLGFPPPGDALLETTGRRTGLCGCNLRLEGNSLRLCGLAYLGRSGSGRRDLDGLGDRRYALKVSR